MKTLELINTIATAPNNVKTFVVMDLDDMTRLEAIGYISGRENVISWEVEKDEKNGVYMIYKPVSNDVAFNRNGNPVKISVPTK